MCLWTHSLNCFLIGQKERASSTGAPGSKQRQSHMQQTAHCYYGETTARVDSPNLLTTPSVSASCHAKLQTPPHPIMHSAADYGSWFSPKMPSSFCSWVSLWSDEPLQGSFESVPRPPLQGLGTLVWSAFGAHPSATAAFSPAQTNRTNSSAIQPMNEAGVKAPLQLIIAY